MSRLLIKDGTVLSLDRAVGNTVGADVLVENGVIVEVGPSLRARGAETIDASQSIVMPGFVDTHRHVWHSLFRNAGREVDVSTLAAHHTAEHIYAATLVGLLGAATAGVTTVVDWADVPGGATFVEATMQAHADAGLHGIVALANTDAVRRAEEVRPSNVTLAAGPSDPDPRDLSTTERVWAAARDAGLRIHSHVGTGAASIGTVARLGGSGLLGEDVTLVHCTHLSDEDLSAIKDSAAGVSLTPAVEMTDGFGAPPLQGFIDRGIRPGLGVGSEIEAPGDIFAQMRLANSIQHATLFDLKLAGKGGVPNLLNTRQVIRYATIDGAVSVGLGDTTGSLKPGKRADIILLRTDRPNIWPVNDPIGAVVWGMDTSNIDWVFVAGRAVVAEGRPTADVARARELAMKAHREVVSAAGMLSEAGGERR